MVLRNNIVTNRLANTHLFTSDNADDLFLISATVVNDRLYCMIVECDSTNTWKVESKELKRVRSSFAIEEAVTA
jgi:hypothetical protein